MIFKASFIENQELIFYIYLALIIFLIALTIYFVIKELHDTK